MHAPQPKRALAREQFVIGEAITRLGMLAQMRLPQRLAPGGPALARQQAGFDPFGQVRR